MHRSRPSSRPPPPSHGPGAQSAGPRERHAKATSVDARGYPSREHPAVAGQQQRLVGRHARHRAGAWKVHYDFVPDTTCAGESNSTVPAAVT